MSSQRVRIAVTNSEEDTEHYEDDGDIEGELEAEYEYADVGNQLTKRQD